MGWGTGTWVRLIVGALIGGATVAAQAYRAHPAWCATSSRTSRTNAERSEGSQLAARRRQCAISRSYSGSCS
jgi:hypothetical protein